MNRFDTREQVKQVEQTKQTEQTVVYTAPDNMDAYVDYRKLHYKNTIPDNRVLVFLTGFCVGMVFFYLAGGQGAGSGGLMDREHLKLLQGFDADQSGLFEYVIGLRLKQLVLCIICSLSSIGGLLAYAVIGWYGFETGVIIFTLVYQYGIKGIFLTFSMFLPHMIFYGIVFLIIFHRYWESDTKCCHNEATEKKGGRQNRIEQIKKIILVFVIFSIGMLCEIYVNPEIMRKMALFF